jgi:hypothetical protein
MTSLAILNRRLVRPERQLIACGPNDRDSSELEGEMKIRRPWGAFISLLEAIKNE